MLDDWNMVFEVCYSLCKCPFDDWMNTDRCAGGYVHVWVEVRDDKGEFKRSKCQLTLRRVIRTWEMDCTLQIDGGR